MQRFFSVLLSATLALAAVFGLGVSASAASTFSPSSIATNTTGTAVTITFPVTIDTASGGTAAEFALLVGGTTYAAASLARTISGSSVVLTLSGSPIANGQTVTLAYTRASNQTKIFQAASANYAANFAATSVTNNVPVPDTTPPALNSLATNSNGTQVIGAYSEQLLTTSVPAASDFALTVAGNSYSNANYTVAITSHTVVLTLTGTAIANRQSITLAYAGGTNRIKDLAGNLAPIYAASAVTNNVPDTTPPSQISRVTSVDGTQMIATFNETLDSTSVPTNTDIQIFLNGVAYTNFSVAISGSQVIMTLLGAPIQYGQVITLNYTPGATPVRDLAGNTIGSVTGTQYINNVPDTTAPALISQTTNVAGTAVTLGYNELLDVASVPAASDFDLKVNGQTYASGSIAVSISGSSVVLTLSGAAITPGQSVTISYTRGTNPIRDPRLNLAVNFTSQFVINSTIDTSAPTTTSQVTDTAGSSIKVFFSEPLNASSVPAAGDFVITIDGATYTPSITVSVADSYVLLALNNSHYILAGQAVNVSYVPGTNKLKDDAGNNVAAFSNLTVANNVAAVSAPTLNSIASNVAGGVVTLTYAVELDASSVPLASDFNLNLNGAVYPSNLLSVAVTGSTVVLTLSTDSIEFGTVVTLSYTGTAIRASSNLALAATFASLQVTNNTAHTAPPISLERYTNTAGTQLISQFDEPLLETSVPASTDITLWVDGVQVTGFTVAISGSRITLTLTGAPIRNGQSITFSYTPGTNPVKDLAGNAGGSVSNAVVQNRVPDTTAPTVNARITNSIGSQITISFSEAIDPASVPAASDFVVRIAGSVYSNANYSVSVSGNDLIILALTGNPVLYGQNVTLTYVAGANPIKDLAGNLLANFTNQLVSNLVTDVGTPIVLSIETNTFGSKLLVQYSERLDTNSVPAPADFVIKIDGATLALNKYTLAITNQMLEITLIGGAVVQANAVVTLSYTPGTHKIRDLSLNNAVAIVQQLVNNLVPDTTGPTITIEPTIRVVQGRTSVGVAVANEAVSWSIRNDPAQLFTISVTSGEIFVSGTSAVGTYSLQITATDHSLNSTDKTIQITIFAGDFPVIEAPAEVRLTQGATAVAIPTSDHPLAIWTEVTDTSGFFSINRTTGAITVSASAPAGIYSYVFSATDEAGFISDAWMIITIEASRGSGDSASSTPAPLSEPNKPVSTTLTSESKVELRASFKVGNTQRNVTFTVQERGTPAGTTVFMFPGMTQADSDAGLLVVEIKAFNSAGIGLHQFSKPMTIDLGTPAPGTVPSSSPDGLNWTALNKLANVDLASHLLDGYYVDARGNAVILTRHLSYFGFKKPIEKLQLISPKASLSLGGTVAISILETKTSSKAVLKTLTPYICPLIGTKTLLAYKAGSCKLIAVKTTDPLYVGATSKVFVLKILARTKK